MDSVDDHISITETVDGLKDKDDQIASQYSLGALEFFFFFPPLSHTLSLSLTYSLAQFKVLEYELRQAHETVESMRQQLTGLATGGLTPTPRHPVCFHGCSPFLFFLFPPFSGSLDQKPRVEDRDGTQKAAAPMDRSQLKAGVTPLEKKTLNFLIYEFLKDNAFKMTGITFSNEVCFLKLLSF